LVLYQNYLWQYKEAGMSSAKQDKARSHDVAARASSPQPETQGAESFDEAAHPSTGFQTDESPRHVLTRGSLLGLQRAIGNQAVARLLNGTRGGKSHDGTPAQTANSARQAPRGRLAGGPPIQRGVKDIVAQIEAREKRAKEERIFGRGGRPAPPPASAPPVVADPEIRVIETFMEQRKVSADYDNEETIQRPHLINAITNQVAELKKLYLAHQADPTNARKREAWQKQLIFLRKQDVVVTDAGDFDPASLAGRLVEYDKAAAKQASSRVSVAGGSFKRSTGEPVDTSNSVTFQKGQGWEIFVMGPGGEIHMASHKIGKYQHSSLLAGGNVAAAGMMRVANGTLLELNNHSGHYTPKEQHMRQVVRHLQANGVPLNFPLEIAAGPNLPPVFWGWAEDYMKAQAAGGLGGEQEFESGSLWHIQKHFLATKGAAAVQQAIEGAGWTIVNLSSGGWYPQKPDGARATPKEMRDLLTAHFGEQATPNVTRD
jgi:hypothetical protein